MKLYKNVCVRNLNNILKNGILPISATGNNDWADGKRANNSLEVIYLFDPITDANVFPNYGFVLLEVEVEAEENQMAANDSNISKYIEYITNEVSPSEIKNVYIPKFLKDYIEIPEEAFKKVTWVEIDADYYKNQNYKEKVKVDEEALTQFAKTTNLYTNRDNYFRGITKEHEMLDLYNVKYKL